MNAKASVFADLKIFGGSVVSDVIPPTMIVGKEMVINIPAAIGLTLSPDRAGVLIDNKSAIARVFHESILRCVRCDQRAPPYQGVAHQEQEPPPAATADQLAGKVGEAFVCCWSIASTCASVTRAMILVGMRDVSDKLYTRKSSPITFSAISSSEGNMRV